MPVLAIFDPVVVVSTRFLVFKKSKIKILDEVTIPLMDLKGNTIQHAKGFLNFDVPNCPAQSLKSFKSSLVKPVFLSAAVLFSILRVQVILRV